MEPVLIYIDSNKIEQSKEFLESTVDGFQAIYDSFLAIGITPTLLEMSHRVQVAKREPNSLALERFAFEKTLTKAQAGAPDFNGIPISPAGLKSLIAAPDISEVTSAINDFPEPFGGTGIGSEPDLLQITNGVVEKKITAYATLEARYSHYTKNDRGADMALKLNGVALKMNEYRVYFGELGWPFGHGVATIDGLEFRNNEYIPDLNLIRKHEAKVS